MAQFDVYVNTNTNTAHLFPYLLDVQNDLFSTLRTRVVVPLAVGITPVRHLNPVFDISGTTVAMSTADIAGISLDYCTKIVTNLESNRNEIVDALDFMVGGF